MNGVYGTVKPANIDPLTDIEIFYSYRPTRNGLGEEFDKFKKLDENILTASLIEDGNEGTILNGMYNLKLSTSIFGEKGIYSIYIRPREYEVIITDVSTLLAFPDVRGIVISDEGLPHEDLTGYRMEFPKDDNSGNLKDETRIITSSSHCRPDVQSQNSTYSNDVKYVFTDTTSDRLFCTVTPSISMSFKPNALPFIGKPGERAILSNTKFDPVMIEIEMAEHDIETISTMLEGTQVRDLDNGKIVTFNDNNDIYSLHEYYTLKDKLGEPMYDVKVRKSHFDDRSDDYKSIIDN